LPDNNETDIIRRVLDGDTEAFEKLVLTHQDRLMGLCRSLLRNQTQAEDAAQAVLIKAFESLSSFNQKSSFFTWVYRIASNHCLDLLRAETRRKTESWEALVEAQGDQIQALLIEPSPGGTAAENQDLVRRVLEQLPPDARVVLELRESQGLTYEEISEVLDLSNDAVKSRLKRARQAFEEKLRHLLGKSRV
jgi:RNA polymerase sigma-70 factor (ECF subfamily)